MPIVYTIEDGICSFTEEFDFGGKSNTERTYLRALALFTEFINSDVANKNPEYRSLTLASPLASLPKYIASGFSSWLRDHDFPIAYRGRPPIIPKPIPDLPPSPVATRKYSVATINLYESALARVLDFWRDRERISFSVLSQKASERASSTRKSRKIKRDVGLKALAVPSDLGQVLMQISQTWVVELTGNASRPEKLKRLRARALVSAFADSGLRVSDLVRLTKEWRYTKIDPSGSVAVDTIKSGTKAQCHFSEQTLFFIDEYIALRDDSSPWLFIQHGKHGTNTATNQADYSRENSNSNDLRRGYGAPISTFTVWKIIRTVADLAGYDRKKGTDYVSTHAIRHWLAQFMRDNDVPLIQIQEALGHSTLEITRAIYAPHSTQKQAINCIDELHKSPAKPAINTPNMKNKQRRFSPLFND